MPPGAEHAVDAVSNGFGQSATVQHVAWAMQLFEAVQTLLPAAQPHEPPAPEQVCPLTLQSVVVQQLVFAMQALLALQGLSPVGHRHEPPMPEHDEPERPLQSALVQHVDDGMQALARLHTL